MHYAVLSKIDCTISKLRALFPELTGKRCIYVHTYTRVYTFYTLDYGMKCHILTHTFTNTKDRFTSLHLWSRYRECTTLITFMFIVYRPETRPTAQHFTNTGLRHIPTPITQTTRHPPPWDKSGQQRWSDGGSTSPNIHI